MREIPEFKSFTFPIIRKSFRKVVSEDLIMTPEERGDLFLGVVEHMVEVFDKLEDCKCLGCVLSDES